MNMKWLWKYVLPGILAAALPLATVQAAPTLFLDTDGTAANTDVYNDSGAAGNGHISKYLIVSGSTYQYSDGSYVETIIDLFGNEIIIASHSTDIDFTGNLTLGSASSIFAGMILNSASDFDGVTVTLSRNVTVQGNKQSNLVGLRGGDFTGVLNFTGDMKVTNTPLDNRRQVSVHGYSFNNLLAGSNVTVGDIDVYGHNAIGTRSDVTGLNVSGNVAGTLTVGAVTAISDDGGTARGVQVGSLTGATVNIQQGVTADLIDDSGSVLISAIGIQIDAVDAASTLNIGKVTVSAAGGVGMRGVSIGGNGGAVGTAVNLNDTITATSTSNVGGGWAVGVSFAGDGNSSLTIKHDVLATATRQGAHAIGLGNVDLVLDTSLNADLSVSAVSSSYSSSIWFSSDTDTGRTVTITGTNTFTNAGRDFEVHNSAGDMVVNFNTDANLADGWYEGLAVLNVGAGKNVNLGTSDINSGNMRGFDAVPTDLILNVGAGSELHTTGVVGLNATSIDVRGGGRVNLRGTIVSDNADNAITISEGSTLAIDGTQITLLSDTVTFHVGPDVGTSNGNTLEVFGEDATPGIKDDIFVFFGAGTNNTLLSKAFATEWYVDGNNLASRQQLRVNDSYLAAMSMHNGYAVWNAVRDKMISGNGNAVRGYRGQSSCDPCEMVFNPCDPCGTFGGNSARYAWVNYTGRNNTYQSAFNGQDWKTSMEGVQVGTDLFRTNRSQFGVIFGYEGGRSYNNYVNRETGVDVNRTDRLWADDTYVGFYGAQVLRGGADVRVAAGFGWQDYTLNRWGTMAPTELYKSAFKGRTTDVNLEMGKRFAAGAWSLRPVIAVDVMNNNLKDTTETHDGIGTEGIKYGKTSLTRVFVRTGSELRYQVRNFTFNSGLYYAYDMNDDVLKTDVTHLASGVRSGLAGTNWGRSMLSLNVGGEFKVTRNFGMFLGYEGEYMTDSTKTAQNAAYVGGVWQW